jgi:hypothetical protein
MQGHGLVQHRHRAALKQRIHYGLNTVRGAFRNGGNEIQFAIPDTVDMLRGSGHKVPASSF